MATRTLACGVPIDLYDRFVGALPEGKSINGQLRELIDGWLDASMYPQHWMTMDSDKSTADAEQMIAAVVSLAPTVVAVEPVMTLTTSTVPDPGCLHPKGVLYRSDRLIVCGACGRTIR